MKRPDNGGTIPSKSTPFTPSSILFRPRGGVAGYRPRVRKVYYDGHLSPYLACASSGNIGAKSGRKKGRSFPHRRPGARQRAGAVLNPVSRLGRNAARSPIAGRKA